MLGEFLSKIFGGTTFEAGDNVSMRVHHHENLDGALVVTRITFDLELDDDDDETEIVVEFDADTEEEQEDQLREWALGQLKECCDIWLGAGEEEE